MLLALNPPSQHDFKSPHELPSLILSSSRASPSSPVAIDDWRSDVIPEKMSQQHRGLPPPGAIANPPPTPAGLPAMTLLGPIPAPPSSWAGQEESMRKWLHAKAEEAKRLQEEEKTKQETVRLDQRRVEQSILRESLQGGIPPVMVPLIFAGMAGGRLPDQCLEWARQHMSEMSLRHGHDQQSQDAQQQTPQASAPPPPPPPPPPPVPAPAPAPAPQTQHRHPLNPPSQHPSQSPQTQQQPHPHQIASHHHEQPPRSSPPPRRSSQHAWQPPLRAPPPTTPGEARTETKMTPSTSYGSGQHVQPPPNVSPVPPPQLFSRPAHNLRTSFSSGSLSQLNTTDIPPQAQPSTQSASPFTAQYSQPSQQTPTSQQEIPQAQSSSNIYFHHWVPPNTSSGPNPPTPSGKSRHGSPYSHNPPSHLRSDHQNSPKKRKATGHHPAPPAPNQSQDQSPGYVPTPTRGQESPSTKPWK